MNIKFQFKGMFCNVIFFIFSVVQLNARPNMRFLSNDKLLLIYNDCLEVLDALKNEHLGFIELPKDGIRNSAAHCDIFCSPEEIFVISRTMFNTLWQLNSIDGIWEQSISTKKFRNKYNSGVRIYSSPNGKHLVYIGTHQPKSGFDYRIGKYKINKSYNKIVGCTNIACDLQKLDMIKWDDVNDIKISNDGKIILILSYKHVPILNKENTEPISLSLSLSCGRTVNAKLSPQGNYVFIKSHEFLALFNTQTLKMDCILRLQKNDILSVFPWNAKMNQFIYFPSHDECISAFKWCAYHIRYDTCPDRLDFIGTLFSNLNTIVSEFSGDESRLLLVTKQAKPFEITTKISVHVFDLRQKSIIFSEILNKADFQTAAISYNGSMIALLTQQGKVMIKDLDDKMRE